MTDKINLAYEKAKIGNMPKTRHAMLASIPPAVIDALPDTLLAELLDAQYALCNSTKDLYAREILAEGGLAEKPACVKCGVPK